MTLQATYNAISLQGSAPGATPCASPDGQTTNRYGRVAALANLSARQAKEMGLLTSGICGPHGTTSSAEEWRAAWLVAKRSPPPTTPPTLGEVTLIVAKFGGFLGRKGDKHPGPKALWEGMAKLMAYVEAIRTVREVYSVGDHCG